MVAATDLRVLIDDDDEEMRRLMRRMLERMGFFQIYAPKDGAEGLELARSQRPDVIISDYDMPSMHGLQLLKAVREESVLMKIAFVMVSGVANGAVAQKADELGASSIIMKPVLAADLQQRLGTLVHQLTGTDVQFAPEYQQVRPTAEDPGVSHHSAEGSPPTRNRSSAQRAFEGARPQPTKAGLRDSLLVNHEYMKPLIDKRIVPSNEGAIPVLITSSFAIASIV